MMRFLPLVNTVLAMNHHVIGEDVDSDDAACTAKAIGDAARVEGTT